MSQKNVFWHSKFYIDNGPESENPILTLKSYFDIHFESENPILTFIILLNIRIFDISDSKRISK